MEKISKEKKLRIKIKDINQLKLNQLTSNNTNIQKRNKSKTPIKSNSAYLHHTQTNSTSNVPHYMQPIKTTTHLISKIKSKFKFNGINKSNVYNTQITLPNNTCSSYNNIFLQRSITPNAKAAINKESINCKTIAHKVNVSPKQRRSLTPINSNNNMSGNSNTFMNKKPNNSTTYFNYNNIHVKENEMNYNKELQIILSLKRKIKTQNEIISQKDNEINKLQNKSLLSKYNELQIENEVLNNEIKKMKTLMSETSNNLRNQTYNINNGHNVNEEMFTNEINELKLNLNSLNEKYNNEVIINKTHTQNIESLKKEHNIEKEELLNKINEYSNINDELQSVKSKLDIITKEKETSDLKNSNLSEIIHHMESEMNTLKEQCQQNENKLNTYYQTKLNMELINNNHNTIITTLCKENNFDLKRLILNTLLYIKEITIEQIKTIFNEEIENARNNNMDDVIANRICDLIGLSSTDWNDIMKMLICIYIGNNDDSTSYVKYTMIEETLCEIIQSNKINYDINELNDVNVQSILNMCIQYDIFQTHFINVDIFYKICTQSYSLDDMKTKILIYHCIFSYMSVNKNNLYHNINDIPYNELYTFIQKESTNNVIIKEEEEHDVIITHDELVNELKKYFTLQNEKAILLLNEIEQNVEDDKNGMITIDAFCNVILNKNILSDSNTKITFMSFNEEYLDENKEKIDINKYKTLFNELLQQNNNDNEINIISDNNNVNDNLEILNNSNDNNVKEIETGELQNEKEMLFENNENKLAQNEEIIEIKNDEMDNKIEIIDDNNNNDNDVIKIDEQENINNNLENENVNTNFENQCECIVENVELNNKNSMNDIDENNNNINLNGLMNITNLNNDDYNNQIHRFDQESFEEHSSEENLKASSQCDLINISAGEENKQFDILEQEEQQQQQIIYNVQTKNEDESIIINQENNDNQHNDLIVLDPAQT